jgi:hypothetical protein
MVSQVTNMGLNAIAENKENFLKDPDSQLIADSHPRTAALGLPPRVLLDFSEDLKLAT